MSIFAWLVLFLLSRFGLYLGSKTLNFCLKTEENYFNYPAYFDEELKIVNFNLLL